MKSGIYMIKNNVDGKVYIGSSKNINKRKNRHFSELRHNKHNSIHLQKAFNKFGEESFSFNILRFTPPDEEIMQCGELEMIKVYDSLNQNKGYNLSSNPSHPDLNLCSKGGKIAGKIAKDRGQIQSIRDPLILSKNGKIQGNINKTNGQIKRLGLKQGKINVESGLLENARKKGVEACSKEYMIIKIDGSKEKIKNLSNYCKINKLPYKKIYGRAERLSNNPIEGIIARKWRCPMDKIEQ